MVVGGVLKVRLGSLRPKTRNWGTGSELSAPPEPWRPASGCSETCGRVPAGGSGSSCRTVTPKGKEG